MFAGQDLSGSSSAGGESVWMVNDNFEKVVDPRIEIVQECASRDTVDVRHLAEATLCGLHWWRDLF